MNSGNKHYIIFSKTPSFFEDVKSAIGSGNNDILFDIVAEPELLAKTIQQLRPSLVLCHADNDNSELLVSIIEAWTDFIFIVAGEKDDARTAVRFMKAGATEYITINEIKSLPAVVSEIKNRNSIKKLIDYNLPFFLSEESKLADDSFTKEQQLHYIQRLAKVAGWVLDVKLNKFFASAEALEMMGFPPDAKPDFSEVTANIHPDDILISRNGFQNALKYNKPYAVDIRFYRVNDGKMIYIRSYGDIVLGENGELTKLIGANQDITELKQAEKKLSETEEIFNSFMLHSPVYVFFKDNDIRSLRLSRNYEKMLGMPLEKLLNKTMDELFPSDLAKRMIEDDKRILNEGKHIEVEEEFNGKHYLTYKFPIHIEGKPKYLAGYTIDITERKASEIALLEKEATFRKLFEESADAIVLMEDGKFFDCNQAALSIFGYTEKEDLIGKRPRDLSPEFQPDGNPSYKKADEYLKTAFENGSCSFEWVHTKADGTPLYIDTLLTTIFIQNKPIIYAVMRDLTERMKAEEELKESRRSISALLANLPGMAYRCLNNSEWTMTFLSEGCKMLTGYDQSDLVNNNVLSYSDVIHPDDRDYVWAEIQDGINRGEHYRLVYRIITASGDCRWVWEKGKAHLNNIGEVDFLEGFITDISDQKAAEDALRESEESLAITLQSIGDAVIATDLKGNITRMNTVAEKLTGWKLQEVLNKPLTDVFIIVNAFNRQQVDNPVEQVLATGKIIGLANHTILIAKDGKEYNISDSAAPIKDRDGLIKGVILTFSDNTEKYQIQEQIRINEERLIEAQRIAQMGSYEIILETGLIIGSPNAFRIYGLPQTEDYLIDSKVVDKLVVDIEIVNKSIRDLVANGIPIEHEFEIMPADGSPMRVIRSRGHLVKDENGNPYKIIGVVQDVTERKKIEKEIRKLSTALEQSPVSIVITDIHGKIEYINPNVTESTGYLLEEVKGLTPRIFKSGITTPETYDNLWNTISSGSVWKGQFLNKKKNGELFWESAAIAPVLDDKGKIINYVAIKEDITELKKVNEELIAAKEKAVESDRLKSEFLAQISHEIRSPLNALLNYNSLLKEEFESVLNDEYHFIFDGINRSSSRIIRTVNLVLNMSEIQTNAYDFRPVKLDVFTNAVESVYKEMKHLAVSKGLNLKIRKLTEDTTAFCDEYSVTQILVNLVDNSIKYTSAGFIEIRLLRNSESKLQIEVEDTGMGIKEEFLPNLFKPFTQEETGYTRRFEGTGLGLSLVMNYCRMNNIEISVFSRKDQGTIFKLIFQ